MRDPLFIVLFGEAQKGEFSCGHICHNLSELEVTFGEPPPHSRGLYFAVQALMHDEKLLFYRVSQEGYSVTDYLMALREVHLALETYPIRALAAPGVGSGTLLEEFSDLCQLHNLILMTNEADLYDYLTDVG